jgi:serine protease inhibitor
MRWMLAMPLFGAACHGIAPAPEAARPAPAASSSAVAQPVASATAPSAASSAPGVAVKPPNPSSGLNAELLRAFGAARHNVFFSAASLRAALSMVALGARGETRAELVQALGLGSDPEHGAEAAAAARAAWRRAAGAAELSVANRLWIDRSFVIEAPFIALCRRGYGASAGRLDFVHAPEPSRTAINHWVSTATHGRIADLLAPSSVNPATRLVVTDAVYFKGKWAEPFAKDETAPEPFYGISGEKNVPTMHLRGGVGYVVVGDVRLIELAYKKSELRMLIVVPKPSRSLVSVLETLSRAELDSWSKQIKPVQMSLGLPRFRLSWGRSVKPQLEALGVHAAFSPEHADFSGIASAKEPLYVSDVFHKAFMVVDETGTEAAAATGVIMHSLALVRPRLVVDVDHPFLFFIRDGAGGPVLFAGSVVQL